MKFKKYTVEQLIELNMLEKPMDGNHGRKHPKSGDYVSKGIPFIMVSDLKNGRINYNTCKFITEEKRGTLDRGFAKCGDVLLTHKATIGATAIVDDKYDELVLTPQITYYRIKKGINNKYLRYYFNSNYFQQILCNWSNSGSTRAFLGITYQLKLPILLPDLNYQEKIVNLLEKFDKKIELNNKINSNLFKMLDVLYQKELTNTKNTKIKTLEEFCNIFTGRKNSNEFDENGANSFFTCANEPLKINSYIHDGPAVIISGNGANTGMARFYNGKFDLYQRTYACTLKKDINPDYIYVLYAIIRNELSNKIKGGTHGSAIPYIVMSDLAKFKLNYNKKVFEEFSKEAKVILYKIQSNKEQNEMLEQLRNILLPKLIDGTINLNKIEFNI